MSRPIEFRAWDCNQKRYLGRISSIEYDLAGQFHGVEGEDSATKSDVQLLYDSVIVEQYTGLKDKNGKEIYEGDIVNKRYVNFAILDSVGVVEMGELYDSDGWTNSSILGWRVCARYEDSSLLDVCSECEVIGNIHENPELLEEAK